MDIRLAEERILVLPDALTAESAEAAAAARRIDAFGTLAKMAGLLSKPKPDEIELVYKERRLQPYWVLTCTRVCAYERTRQHVLKLPPEVRQITVMGEVYDVQAQQAAIQVMESCREESRKDAVFDALTGEPAADIAAAARTAAMPVSEEALSALADNTVLVPPKAKAAVVVRDLLNGLSNKIDADRLIEEAVSFEAIDLYYRPVYAFRYRRQGKEAVVEYDALTGVARPGGATFETYLGKILEPKFLFDVTVETANIFFPGATLARVIVNKSLEFKKR
jgi:hypothetical protein